MASRNSAKTEVKEETVTETVAVEETANRIPAELASNNILADFCNRYMETFDAITEYNKAVLASKDSEWNSHKILAEAKKMAYPDSGEANGDVKKIYEVYEAQLSELAKARKAVLDAASEVLGISLSAVADKDPEVENDLKEKRKVAFVIGKQLATIAEMSTDDTAKEIVKKWLNDYPLPNVGRDSSTSLTDNGGKGTPKYRVKVTIFKDGEAILEEDGFSKTAIQLSKPVFGYERGKQPTPDKLRAAWENAGNSVESTVQNPVEFDDNGLHYVITKK